MAERIKEHPILGIQEKGAVVEFTFDGKEMEGMEGEPIVLWSWMEYRMCEPASHR